MTAAELTSTLRREEQKLLACIHCGLCLEACPTYVITGDENDGPRGRLYLMRAVGEGRLASSSETFERHIDRCLGCRACESVCPAGVEYGQLLEAGRGEIFHSSERRGVVYGFLRTILRHIWLQPARLKFAFGFARVLRNTGLIRVLLATKLPRIISPRLEFAFALLESSKPTKSITPKRSTAINNDAFRSNVLLFKGCVSEGLFSRVNEATTRVLNVNGYRVKAPESQVCCGALHAHAGDLTAARQLARQNINAFGDEDSPIITNAGGCGAMLLSYGHLLATDEPFAEKARKFSARVRDITQQLDKSDIVEGAAINCKRVTYDASCHLLYAQKAVVEPLKALARIPELELIPLKGADRCCGGAGVYNLLEREMSQLVLNQKLDDIKESGAETLATGNAGCHMHIGAGALLSGLDLQLRHPVELLDDSYRNAGYYENEAES